MKAIPYRDRRPTAQILQPSPRLMGATHSTAANERALAQLWEAVETRDCAMLEQLLQAAPRCALHSRPHDQFSVLHQAASE